MNSHTYPATRREDMVEDLHGNRVADPYRWLEDAAAPETEQWSAAQDALYAHHRQRLESTLANGPLSTATLSERLRALHGAGFVGVPIWRGVRRFYLRRTGDQERAVIILAEPDGGGGEVERVLVDPIALDPSGTTTLDSWQPSKEGDLLAYQVSHGGTEESVLHVLDVATGELVDGPVDRARYSPVAWEPGGRAFFYVRRLAPELVPDDERQFHRRVWRHVVGTDPATDHEVFGDGLELTNYYGVQVSRDGRWLLVSAAAGTAPRTDVWIADLTATTPGQPLNWREVAVGYDAEIAAWIGLDGRLYIHTTLDADRGRVVTADPTDPAVPNWRTLLPEDPEAVLEDVAFTDEGDPTHPVRLVAAWRRHAISELSVHHPLTGDRLPGEEGRIELPGLGSIGALVTRPEGGQTLWFTYTDHTTVPTVYSWDTVTGHIRVWATSPGTVADLPDVRVQQVVATSPDGTPIRAFVMARRDALDPQGQPLSAAPTILYGYGGFQISLDPEYSAAQLAWVEAGGVYVIANLRGGGEEGEAWHRARRREHKHHVFADFHAVSDLLIAYGWTTPGQLACWGGSNGGLLVGATLTQHPDRYAAVVCSAPLLDMVRYQRFGLGTTWTDEYGDADMAEELSWLLGYSPYHHVVEGRAFPATLFTIFDGDTRVDPLHARKLAAALQHATSADSAVAPILIRREKKVGHGGRSLSRTIALTTEQVQFVADRTGLARP